MGNNPFLLRKLTQIKMVKQWVQPLINKNRLPPGGFLLGTHLTSCICYFYYSGFH